MSQQKKDSVSIRDTLPKTKDDKIYDWLVLVYHAARHLAIPLSNEKNTFLGGER